MYLKLFKNQRGGTIILMTVLILTSIIGVTIMASETIRLGIIAGRTQADSTKAYFAAEAGAERILWEDRKGTFDFTACTNCLTFGGDPGAISGCDADCAIGINIKQTLANNSAFKIRYDYTDPDTVLKSYGSYQGAQRVVELSY
jgi:hypothetical protein